MSGNKKRVNITVDQDVWEAMSDRNRSQICNQALQAEHEGYTGDLHPEIKTKLSNMATHRTKIEQLEEEITETQAVKERYEQRFREERNELHELLDERIGDGVDDRDPDLANNEFELTVVFAGGYAQDYSEMVDDGTMEMDKEDIKRKIIRDMEEEGSQLPEPVAEWIVERVTP